MLRSYTCNLKNPKSWDWMSYHRFPESFPLKAAVKESRTTDLAIATHFCDATWAPGALALAASLKKAGSKHNLVVMITSPWVHWKPWFQSVYVRLFL